MKKLSMGLKGVGALVTALSLYSCNQNASSNVNGDGIEPAHSITSRVLGVDRNYHCVLNGMYDPNNAYGEDDPWICELFPYVESPSHVRVDPFVGPVEVIEPDGIRQHVAKTVGPNLEFALGIGLIGLGAYIGRRKEKK